MAEQAQRPSDREGMLIDPHLIEKPRRRHGPSLMVPIIAALGVIAVLGGAVYILIQPHSGATVTVASPWNTSEAPK